MEGSCAPYSIRWNSCCLHHTRAEYIAISSRCVPACAMPLALRKMHMTRVETNAKPRRGVRFYGIRVYASASRTHMR